MSRVRPKYTQGMNEIRRLLDRIGSMDADNYKKDHLLWNILTALRGPDNDNETLKGYTTSRLRGKVCPMLSTSAGAHSTSEGDIHHVNLQAENTPRHFNRHFNWAVEALAQIKSAGR